MSDLRLVVFDCDGTLVDSQHMIFAAMQRAFVDLGMAVPEKDKVRRIVGLGLVEGVALLVPDLGREVHTELAHYYKAAFREIRATSQRHEPLFPGIREALESLSNAGYLLGVATGKSRVGLAATLAVHDLADYFVTCQTADDAPGKPHPGMLEQAIEETGVIPGNALMIGDTTFDMQMAKHAGVTSLGVSWGYHEPDELMRAGAHALAETGGQLFAHAERILSQAQAVAPTLAD